MFPDLSATVPDSIIGIESGRLVSDIVAYRRSAFADGVCPMTWRQGLKHDAASVMELTRDGRGRLQNQLAERVGVEAEHLYPLLKSSDVFNNAVPRRWVIVPQKRLGEDTRALKKTAPRLWRYLTKHSDLFLRRKSSIYKGQPPFALFGIGDYSFSPYKVGISGLYKSPRFRAILPVDGRAVMLDDTAYFVPCESAIQAAILASLLNDPLSIEFIRSITFSDSKRPLTKKVLQSIDVKALLDRVNARSVRVRAEEELRRLGVPRDAAANWPTALEELLVPAQGQLTVPFQ